MASTPPSHHTLPAPPHPLYSTNNTYNNNNNNNNTNSMKIALIVLVSLALVAGTTAMTACTDKGWTWDAKTRACTRPAGTADKPAAGTTTTADKPAAGTTTADKPATTTEDPAKRCTDGGGTWDATKPVGSKCTSAEAKAAADRDAADAKAAADKAVVDAAKEQTAADAKAVRYDCTFSSSLFSPLYPNIPSLLTHQLTTHCTLPTTATARGSKSYRRCQGGG